MTKKHTIKICQEFALKKNGKCLSEKYVNKDTKMKWECELKHIWKLNFNSIKNQNQWCPECIGKRPSIKKCKDFAIKKNGKCLSEKYVNCHTKMKWECKLKHEWEARFSSIKNNSWCAECVGKKKHTIKICKDFALKKNGKCLSEKYVNALTKMKWECESNHKWETAFNEIKNRGSWCPYCSKSRSEKLCREIFENHFQEKFPTRRPKFLHGLELDGYNKELNISFEYNGIQHYKYIPFFHRNGIEDFKKQRQRDMRKYAICTLYDVRLILIPYHFNYQNPEELKIYILDEISKLR